jgi:hypothetical protein
MGEKRRIREALAAVREALRELGDANDGLRAVSPALLARALRAVLLGQALLLERLGGDDVPDVAERSGPTPRIRPIPPDAIEADDDAEKTPRPAPEPLIPRRPAAAAPEQGRVPQPPAAAATAASSSEPVPRPPGMPDFAARFPAAAEQVQGEAIAAFPLDEINRWLGSGTIFQIRGSLAFLNLRSMGGVKVDELRGHLSRSMGFTDELGRLVVSGLAGDVLLIRKPG